MLLLVDPYRAVRNRLVTPQPSAAIRPKLRLQAVKDHQWKYATSAGSNLEYDFARRVRANSVLEGVTCAGERKYFGDDRLELSFFHERGDLIQLPAISIDDEKDSTGAVLR